MRHETRLFNSLIAFIFMLLLSVVLYKTDGVIAVDLIPFPFLGKPEYFENLSTWGRIIYFIIMILDFFYVTNLLLTLRKWTLRPIYIYIGLILDYIENLSIISSLTFGKLTVWPHFLGSVTAVKWIFGFIILGQMYIHFCINREPKSFIAPPENGSGGAEDWD